MSYRDLMPPHIGQGPGSLAQWDQLLGRALTNLRAGPEFFYLATSGDDGIETAIAFRQAAGGTKREMIETLELVRSNVDTIIERIKEQE